jgi:hypothetical protein
VNSAISVVVAVLVLSPRSPYGFSDAGWIVTNSPTIFAFLSCLNHAANSLASSSETEVVFPGTIGWDGASVVVVAADASATTDLALRRQEGETSFLEFPPRVFLRLVLELLIFRDDDNEARAFDREDIAATQVMVFCSPSYRYLFLFATTVCSL